MRLRAALALACFGGAALAQDGRAVFEGHCASCHAVQRAAPEQAGPNLHGVMGRRVGSAAGFGYSPVLETACDAGESWDRDRLLRFLADPEEMYPGVWMGANGLRRAPEREAVADYLQSVR